MSTETIAVALSGGIDSLTAAHILKQEGHKLIGLHFSTGFENVSKDKHIYELAKAKAKRLGKILGIQVYAVNLEKQFKDVVISYFVNSYSSGITPNPCLVCNPAIKFGVLAGWVRKIGASRLATGHYARRIIDSDGRVHLFRGLDRAKDQSYFLARLNRSQLRMALFPLGELKKTQVFEIANQNNIHPLEKQESQDVCFITGSKNQFLENQPEFKIQPGPVSDLEGNILGCHQGLHRFTVGQRKGINIPAKHAYYVVRIDWSENRLVVGNKEDTFSKCCAVKKIKWINPPAKPVLQLSVRIRYRHRAAPATVELNGDKALVRFDQPQSSVTPGQGAVFYQGEEVLGGGWIE